jgi:hypothetical protein
MIKGLREIIGNMKQRCNNPKHPSYDRYGARGITVCKEWDVRASAPFVKWALANGYEEGLEIDRRDNDKGYSPDNCRWVTREVQTRNVTTLCKNNTTGYKGVYRTRGIGFRAIIMVSKENILLGVWDTKILAAKAYDYYVVSNNLEHSINGVLSEGEVIDIDGHKKLGRDNKSGYVGVSKRKTGWTARIHFEGKYKSLGVWSTAIEAAKVREKFIIKHNLKFKRNFDGNE